MEYGIPFPNISPEIVSFTIGSFEFALRWYAMAYIVGMIIGWRIAVAALKRPGLWPGGSAPIPPEEAENLLTWIVLGVIAGGRLGYVLFYKPLHYLQNPIEIPMIWTGGMSFHGGFIGVVLVVFLFARKHGARLSALADMVALATPPALLLGRIANFINAELWGRPTTLPWGVIFPGEAAQACAAVAQACVRHPSQLYEALLEGLLLLTVMLWLAFRRGALRMPWLLSGVFFAGYGLSRFVVEFVRQPDAHFQGPGNPMGLAFHIGGAGLTMGQLLTLPMIAVGVVVILAARRGHTR